jgi:hypothetical protein
MFCLAHEDIYDREFDYELLSKSDDNDAFKRLSLVLRPCIPKQWTQEL